METPASAVDPQVLEDLRSVEQGTTLFGACGVRPEFWEAFTFLKTDRRAFEGEVRRLGELRKQGTPASVSPEVLERIKSIRRDLYPLAKSLRAFIESLPGALDGMRLELALVFIMSSRRGRESAARWVADPISQRADAEARLRIMRRLMDAYQRALLEQRAAAPPEETIPLEPPKTTRRLAPNVQANARFLEDFRRASHLLGLLKLRNQPPELWEALCLVMVERSEADVLIDEVRRQGQTGRVGERLGMVRQRYGKFVSDLRAFLAGVFGRWEGEIEETALAIIAASPKGRHRARQWLDDPDLCRGEATRFVESLRERTRDALSAAR